MIKKLINRTISTRRQERQAELYRNLIRHEAKIGGKLFGPVPKGGRREFFCLDKRTWVWHEEWIDANGQRQIKTTRYDVRPDGILKAQDDQPYKLVSLEEAKNLQKAAHMYWDKVTDEIYSLV